MLALSICNIAGSFIGSMPSCGAFTRSALAKASGVQTTLSNIYASSLVLLAIMFLTPHFHLIPRAVLSSVLISAVIFMVDYQIVKPLWKTNREFLRPCRSFYRARPVTRSGPHIPLANPVTRCVITKQAVRV